MATKAKIILTGGTFDVAIPSGTTQSPAVAIPADVGFLNVEITRDNWPVGGATVELRFSFDGGSTYVTKAGPTFIDQFVPTPKQTTPTPAPIGWGWNPDIFGQPTHARGRISNVATGFNATISLTTG